MAKNIFNTMDKLLTSREINNSLKMRLVNCYVYSTLMYGAETWTMNMQLESRIEALEMWIYRRIGRISWKQKQSNETVLRILGMKRQLLNNIKKRQVKYFGHVKRHDTIIKNILEGKVEGRRARGRQRYRWVDNIKRWTNISLSECTTRARDRVCWRSIVANLHCGDGT